jgi:GcrA cell cycle regulator
MATLSRLWTEGMSANQIASVLGEGITRNAVIGKLHRLGLSGNDKNSVRFDAANPYDETMVEDLRVADVVSADPKPATLRQDEAIVIAKKPKPAPKSAVSIAELTEGMCRWPAEESESGGFRYCGEPTDGTAPYCVSHCKLAYQPSKPIRRKPDRNSLFPGIVIEAPK